MGDVEFLKTVAGGGVVAIVLGFVLWVVFQRLIPRILADSRESLAEAHRINESQAKQFAETIQHSTEAFAKTVDAMTTRCVLHHQGKQPPFER